MLCLFPRDVLDEILDLTESVSEGFPTYSLHFPIGNFPSLTSNISSASANGVYISTRTLCLRLLEISGLY